MKTNVFLAAAPNYDVKAIITQKIHNCEAKRSPLVKIDWVHTQDLHITLGYITQVEEAELRLIAQGFNTITQAAPFMINVEDVRLYGSAIILRLEPHHRLANLHKKMNQRLIEVTNNLYQFETKARFDPHMTIGRLKNLRVLNDMHQHQLKSLILDQFKTLSFLIQQAGLFRRLSEHAHPNYQSLQLYTLSGS